MPAKRKKFISVGSVTFRTKLKRKGWGGTAEVATKLGKGTDLISRWATGDRQPSSKDRARLEDDYAIPWRSWDTLLSDRQEKALAKELEAAAEPGKTFQADSGPANRGAGHAA